MSVVSKMAWKGCEKISAQEVKEYEPYVTSVEGMWVPQTGIVDYKSEIFQFSFLWNPLIVSFLDL